MTQQFWCRKQTWLPLLVGNSQNLWSWLIKLSRNVGLFVRLRGPQYPHNLLMEPFWTGFSYGLCSSHYWLSWWCNRVVPIGFRPSNSSKGFWFQTQLVKLTAGHSKCPTEFHHLETSTWKLRHHLSYQRLLFHYHILTRKHSVLRYALLSGITNEQ